ncbi:hypothetical protein [Lyngbya aestuarii]|uniref:hypothetical protein n=1 Tax=Lyngbya aestuarii TaxID=118322 RepID=UPI00403DB7A1
MTTQVLLLPLLSAFLLFGGYPGTQLAQSEQPAQLEQLQWQEFSDTQGGFTVMMPEKPTQKTQSQKDGPTSIDIHTFTVSPQSNAITYSVSYSDVPSGIEQFPPQLVLDSIGLGLARDQNIRLLGEQDISLGNYPGKEFKLEISQKVILRHRAYLVDKRLYQLTAEAPVETEEMLSEDIERFMNSFELL